MDLEDELDLEWFCPEPFTNIFTDTTGAYKSCCASKDMGYGITTKDTTPKEALNCAKAKRMRKAFLENDKEYLKDPCSVCIKQEQTGMKSHRQFYLDRFKQKSEESDFVHKALDMVKFVKEVRKDPDKDIDPPFYHSMEFLAGGGNYCNLRCAMCAASCSSSYSKESYDLKEDQGLWHKATFGKHKYQPPLDKRIDKEMDQILPKLQEIKLTGGEPLAIPWNYKMLKRSVELGAAQGQILRIITNGTMTPTNFNTNIFQLIPDFKKVYINVSIEAWGEKNNYIRYPSDFNVILDNANRFAENFNTEVTFCSTVNALNIGFMDEMITGARYANEKFLKSVGTSYVTADNQTAMNVASVPYEIREQYLDRYYSMDVDLAKLMMPYIELLQEENFNEKQCSILMKRMYDRDIYRGTNLLEYWPEWEPYYENLLR